jgi:hypothetical protein
MTVQRVSSVLRVVKARRRPELVALLGIAAFLACGGSDDAPADTPPPDDGTSSSSSSSSSGDNGPKPGSSSGDPNETVNCDAPTKQSTCTLSDPYFAFDVDLTTDKDCKTSLYVSGRPTPEGSDFKVRRYTLKTLDPCVFEKDATFTELVTSDVIGADDAGDVISVGTKVVELLKGDQRIKCDGELPPQQTHLAVLARDGAVGYLGHYDTVNDKIANIVLSKVTITGDTCAVAAFPLTGGDPLSGLNSIAIDTKGRIQVADTTYSGDKRPDRIVIYDADGKLVSTYKGVDPEAYFSPTSITPCKGGVCVDGVDAVFSFDENGILRGHAKLVPKETMATLVRYVGSTRGPFFIVGNNDVEPRHLQVEAMVRP